MHAFMQACSHTAIHTQTCIQNWPYMHACIHAGAHCITGLRTWTYRHIPTLRTLRYIHYMLWIHCIRYIQHAHTHSLYPYTLNPLTFISHASLVRVCESIPSERRSGLLHILILHASLNVHGRDYIVLTSLAARETT